MSASTWLESQATQVGLVLIQESQAAVEVSFDLFRCIEVVLEEHLPPCKRISIQQSLLHAGWVGPSDVVPFQELLMGAALMRLLKSGGSDAEKGRLQGTKQ